MYSLDSITLKRFHLYRDEVTLPFLPGITQVAGPNYSGKTLFASAIPTMLDLVHEKTGLDKPPKSSYLHFSYHKDEKKIDFAVQTAASSKFMFGIDGEDMKPHKKVDAQSLLLQNWTIPQALFDSTIFLRAANFTHPLATGTPGTRSTWLSEALDLTAMYDAYKMEVDAKISELGKIADKIEVLKAERDKVEARIPESKVSQKQAKKAKRLLKKHRALLEGLPQRIQEIENTVRLIGELEDLPHFDRSMEYYQDKLDKYRVEKAELSKIAEQLDAVKEAQEHNQRIKDKMRHLEKNFPDLAAHIAFGDADAKLRKKIREADDVVEKYMERKAAYDEQADIREELELFKQSPDGVLVSNNLEEAEAKLAELQYRDREAKNRIEALESVDAKATDCPTCGSPLTAKHRKQEIKRLTMLCDGMPHTIKGARKEVRYWKLKGVKLLKKPEKPSFTSKELRDWREMLVAIERWQDLAAKIKQVPKIKAKDVSGRLRKLTKLVKRYGDLRHAATLATALRGQLPEQYESLEVSRLTAIKHAMEDQLATLKEDRKHSGDIVRKYSEVEIQYETQRKVAEQHRATVSRLGAEISELQNEVKDLAAWKALALAFGNSGVRLYQLRESAAVLAAQLTELSGLFFNTTYRFEIEVAPGKLNVMVERNGALGSVKTLSGAESRCWNLLCAMAMMRILPNHMRCDTIFLDEIEANMDKNSRDRYVKDVIPELQRNVPKLVVITPLINGEMNIKADHDYRVVKEHRNGVWSSRLVAN
ncbi:DNA repair exonuclease subunit 2 protein [Rhizobium phage RHph_N46]|nr:DNA repair exonuclease subunit 2 protein [Rhizobium phage RHph_N46]